MKSILKLINFIYKNRFKVSIILFVAIILIGFIGNYSSKAPNFSGFWKSLLETLSLFGLNTPDNINPFTIIAFFLTYLLLFGNFIFFLFKEKFNVLFARNLLKDKNIVFFGFGEINKKILENLTEEKKQISVIVVDKEAKNFDEFWEKGYVFLKKEIDNELINKFDFEKTTDIVVVLGNDRVNIDIALKLLDKLKDVKTETKLIIHLNDREISDLFFEKLEEIKKEKKDVLINLKTFSFYTEIVDNLFEKYIVKLVPYEYSKFNSNKKELKIAVIGNSDVNLEVIKRIFVNFIFPNEVKIKIFLIDEDEKKFYEKVKFETNYIPQKFPHIILEPKKLNFSLLSDKSFWFQDNLIDIIIAFDDENKNLETTIDLFEKIFIHKNNIQYPNVFFAIYKELLLSKYIDENKKNFENFFTFGNMREVLKVENLLDDGKFEVAMKIHNTWEKRKDIKRAWYSTSFTNRLSSIAQAEHIDFKLLSLGFIKTKNSKNDNTKEYIKIMNKIEKEGITFEEFLNSEDYYKLCNTEHSRWMAYHFINNWEYDDFEGKDKDEKELKKSLKLHNCLIDFKDFKYDSIKNTFVYDFYAYKNIPKYLKGKYKIIKINLKDKL